jgi:hypothetical protein
VYTLPNTGRRDTLESSHAAGQWQYHIKMNFREIGFEDVKWNEQVLDSVHWFPLY